MGSNGGNMVGRVVGGGVGVGMHERSHSDTPTPLPSVDLSAESSSVTSLSNMPLRKTVTSGKISNSDCTDSIYTNNHRGDRLI